MGGSGGGGVGESDGGAAMEEGVSAGAVNVGAGGGLAPGAGGGAPGETQAGKVHARSKRGQTEGELGGSTRAVRPDERLHPNNNEANGGTLGITSLQVSAAFSASSVPQAAVLLGSGGGDGQLMMVSQPRAISIFAVKSSCRLPHVDGHRMILVGFDGGS